MTLRRGETGDTPEEIQTNKEISEYLQQQQQQYSGVTMDDLPIKSVSMPPRESAMPPIQQVKHPLVMERQPLHREYGGPHGGTLCTCAIGADHTEAGVRMNALPTPAVDDLAKKMSELATQKVCEELQGWVDRLKGAEAQFETTAFGDGTVGKTANTARQMQTRHWREQIELRIKHLKERLNDGSESARDEPTGAEGAGTAHRSAEGQHRKV